MKERLDVLLVSRGLYPSRERARAAIMAGDVTVDGRLSDKAGNQVDIGACIEIRQESLPYVGRGGLKLEKALDLWPFPVRGSVCMDIGASTGGFTDCMLQRGAARVYAIDVGKGQLAWKLRTDARVICLEGLNVRYLTREQVPEDVDLISIDVSFISLRLVLPVATAWLKAGGRIICLAKPQFEVGRARVGKHGIVRDRADHRQVLRDVIDYGVSAGLSCTGISYSPITGAKGNIEFLLAFERAAAPGREKTAGSADGRVFSGVQPVDASGNPPPSAPGLDMAKRSPVPAADHGMPVAPLRRDATDASAPPAPGLGMAKRSPVPAVDRGMPAAPLRRDATDASAPPAPDADTKADAAPMGAPGGPDAPPPDLEATIRAVVDAAHEALSAV